MKSITNKFAIYGSILALALMSGCSTLEGVGKDMQSLGQGIGNSNSGNKQAPSSEQPNANGAVVTPIK